jgi:hypothetical protein
VPAISLRDSSHTQHCHVDHSIETPMYDHQTGEERSHMLSQAVTGGNETASIPVIRVFPPSHASTRSASLPRRVDGPTQAPEMRHDTAHQHEFGTFPTGRLPSLHRERSSRPRVPKPLTTAESQATNDQSRYPFHTVSYEPLEPTHHYHQMHNSYRRDSDRPSYGGQRLAGVDENVAPNHPPTIPQVLLPPKRRHNAPYGQTESRSPPRMARFGSQSLFPASSHARRARFSSPPTIEHSDDQKSEYDLPSRRPESDVHVYLDHHAQRHSPVR